MMVRVNILAGAVLASGSPSPGAEPRIHEIEIDNLAFAPAPEVLHVNDSVEWVNADIFQHTATAADGSFDVDLPAGAKGRTILKRVGERIAAATHHAMLGLTAPGICDEEFPYKISNVQKL
jgi:plastocyanin